MQRIGERNYDRMLLKNNCYINETTKGSKNCFIDTSKNFDETINAVIKDIVIKLEEGDGKDVK